jgi:Fe-S cluster biogenesis protein NfuA
MLPESMSVALAEIATRLDSAGIAYCIGGSAMLALAGFDTSVGDIDVVVDRSSRDEVERVFSDHYERQSAEPWRSEWLLRARWRVGDSVVGVDVIGGLGLMVDDSLARFPVVHSTTAVVDGVDVALAPIAHWYHLYRVHSPDKAEMIASILTDDEIVGAAGELGIGDIFSPTLIVRIGNDSAPNEIEEDMSTDQQSSIIEVASPTDVSFDAPGSEVIDLDLLTETLEYIRPALQADGGDLVLLGTEGGKVTLQMVGACGGCPLSTMTLTAGIERIVRDRVPGVTEVVSI